MYEKDRLVLLQKIITSSEPLSSSALAFMLNVSVKTLLRIGIGADRLRSG